VTVTGTCSTRRTTRVTSTSSPCTITTWRTTVSCLSLCVQPNNSSKRSASGNNRARRGRVGLAFVLLVGWSRDIRFLREIGCLGRNRLSGSQSDLWVKLCETVPISCHPQASFPATLERYPIAHGWDLQQNDTCIA